MSKSFVIQQAYYFETAPENVFQALTDSKTLAKWFLSRAKLVPEKGGRYTFDWIGGYHMKGRVKQFEINKAVSYSWTDKLKNGELEKTTANFKVEKKGHGTLLRLRHTGFRDPVQFAECSSRWGYYLTNMKSVLDHGVDLRSKHDW